MWLGELPASPSDFKALTGRENRVGRSFELGAIEVGIVGKPFLEYAGVLLEGSGSGRLLIEIDVFGHQVLEARSFYFVWFEVG